MNSFFIAPSGDNISRYGRAYVRPADLPGSRSCVARENGEEAAREVETDPDFDDMQANWSRRIYARALENQESGRHQSYDEIMRDLKAEDEAAAPKGLQPITGPHQYQKIAEAAERYVASGKYKSFDELRLEMERQHSSKPRKIRYARDCDEDYLNEKIAELAAKYVAAGKFKSFDAIRNELAR